MFLNNMQAVDCNQENMFKIDKSLSLVPFAFLSMTYTINDERLTKITKI